MFLVAGHSESSLVQTLKSVHLSYSKDEITKSKKTSLMSLQLFKHRELPESILRLTLLGIVAKCKIIPKSNKLLWKVGLGIDL
ncbi:MAG: putative transposase [Epulopiscium sp.]|jgi:protein-arginine kinase|nr:putative transposase [Thermoanaerobacter sp.]MDK2788263.1 putative transposase [Candidatus Epulonipiscium sp.]